MNKIKGSFWAKAIAWILFLASATTAVISIFIIVYNFSNNVYFAKNINEVIEDNYTDINREYSLNVWLNYRYTDEKSDNMLSKMYEQGFRYGIIEAASVEDIDFNDEGSYMETNFFMGDIVENIDKDNLYVYQMTRTISNDNSEEVSSTYMGKYSGMLHSTNSVVVKTDTAGNDDLIAIETDWIFSVIPENVTPDLNGNQYEQSAWYVSFFYGFRIISIIIFAASAVIAVFSLIYLLRDAGYRKGSSEIHIMAFPDKIPFDIWSAIVFAILIAMAFVLVVALIYIYDTTSPYNMAYGGNLDMLVSVSFNLIMAIWALALWYALGFAVRVKKGKWYHNTICYRIIIPIKNTINKIWENIGLIWKFIAIVATLFMIRIFTVNLLDVEGLFVVNIIIKIVAYIAIISMIIQFGQLQTASKKLADGNLSYKVDTSKMLFDFKKHGENLNMISEGMAKAVNERMKSERFKTELITNVSHDIKTPLTSIINYVDLLEKEELNNDKATEYLEVLDRQSSKLKKLIEDLVEASKASSGNLPVNLEKLDACVFITQTVGEFEEKLSIAGLELIIKKPEEPVFIMADGRHLWRIVDNLMNNICKYAQPQSRVYVNLEADANVRITFRNISKYQLNVSGDELMERFVRGDKSRNTEGHGLGLSIAQSLVTLISGKMEIVVDGDLFKVVLEFDKVE